MGVGPLIVVLGHSTIAQQVLSPYIVLGTRLTAGDTKTKNETSNNLKGFHMEEGLTLFFLAPDDGGQIPKGNVRPGVRREKTSHHLGYIQKWVSCLRSQRVGCFLSELFGPPGWECGCEIVGQMQVRPGSGCRGPCHL